MAHLCSAQFGPLSAMSGNYFVTPFSNVEMYSQMFLASKYSF